MDGVRIQVISTKEKAKLLQNDDYWLIIVIQQKKAPQHTCSRFIWVLRRPWE